MQSIARPRKKPEPDDGPVYLSGMHGLGDNIYTRSILPGDRIVYLQTPWPQLFQDMPNIRPVRANSRLRTQKKNEAEIKRYVADPAMDARKISYTNSCIIEGLEKTSGFKFRGMSLPDFGSRWITGRYAVIRPSTLRSEWMAAARNPRPEYLVEAACQLHEAGYTVIAVADIDGKNEWPDGEIPPHDMGFLAGELSATEMLRLVQNADAIVGGVGWILPAGIAYRRNSLVICGGEGGWNSPAIITDKRMDLKKTTFAVPDNLCLCRNHRHDCDKKITRFSEICADWIANLVA